MDAFNAQRRGATIIDIRTAADCTAEGTIPHAVVIALSVLPWRADPDAETTDERVNDLGQHLILVCDDGYSST